MKGGEDMSSNLNEVDNNYTEQSDRSQEDYLSNLEDNLKSIVLEIMKDEQKNANQAVESGIQSHSDPRVTIDQDQALISTLHEFLDSFAIIGYDFDGVPVCISSASTIQKKEALDSLTGRYYSAITRRSQNL